MYRFNFCFLFLLSSTIEHLLPLFLTMLKDEVKLFTLYTKTSQFTLKHGTRLSARWASRHPVDGHLLKKIVLFFIHVCCLTNCLFEQVLLDICTFWTLTFQILAKSLHRTDSKCTCASKIESGSAFLM